MAVNSVTVIGNLGVDPQVRALPSGQSVVNLVAGDDRALYGPQRREAGTD